MPVSMRSPRNCVNPNYAPGIGRPGIPPGRYFRMHLVGYFEGLDSERALEWRCADSLSLREFLRLEARARVPDHSSLSTIRSRLPHAVHEAVFAWVLDVLGEHGLVKGERIGVDASTMEANAALRSIVRRDSGESYRQMLQRMAADSGIETAANDLAQMDRRRKGKKLSNADWVSTSDAEAKIARMKDGTTHLAYKPEHAVDLDTGAVIAAELYPADQGDTTTLPTTLTSAEAKLAAVGAAPTADEPAELVTDKGYFRPRGAEVPCRRRLDDPHRRTEGQGVLVLARRRRRPAGRLQQPQPIAVGRGEQRCAAGARAFRARYRGRLQGRERAAVALQDGDLGDRRAAMGGLP